MSGDLERLAADLRRAGKQVMPGVVVVTGLAAKKIETTAQQNVRALISGTYLPYYPDSITSEVHSTGMTVTAEIGPDASLPQGGMSVEFGSSRPPGPRPHLFPASETVEPDWLDGLAKVAGDFL